MWGVKDGENRQQAGTRLNHEWFFVVVTIEPIWLIFAFDLIHPRLV